MGGEVQSDKVKEGGLVMVDWILWILHEHGDTKTVDLYPSVFVEIVGMLHDF